jgi:cell division protein FtsL
VGRLNAMLLVLVIACALGVITSQNRARKLFNDLDNEQAAAKKLGEEYSQLQLEQSTWGTHQRVEAIASRDLHMRLPDPESTVIIAPVGTIVRPEAVKEARKP